MMPPAGHQSNGLRKLSIETASLEELIHAAIGGGLAEDEAIQVCQRLGELPAELEPYLAQHPDVAAPLEEWLVRTLGQQATDGEAAAELANGTADGRAPAGQQGPQDVVMADADDAVVMDVVMTDADEAAALQREALQVLELILVDLAQQPTVSALTDPELAELHSVCRAITQAAAAGPDRTPAVDAAAPSVQSNREYRSVHTGLAASQTEAERLLLQFVARPDPALARIVQQQAAKIRIEIDQYIRRLSRDPERKRCLKHFMQRELDRLPFMLAAGNPEPSGADDPSAEPSQPTPTNDPTAAPGGPDVRSWMRDVQPPSLDAAGPNDAGAPAVPPPRAVPRDSPTDAPSTPTSTENQPSRDPAAAGSQRNAGATAAAEPLSPRGKRAAALPDFYVVNSQVAMEEDDVQEFKDYSLGSSDGWARMQSAVQKTVNSFLNRSGGRMFFGITDEGRVKGIALDKRMKDKIRLEWDGIMNNMWPQVDIAQVNFKAHFIKVVDGTGTQLTDRAGTPVWVAVISVEADPNLKEMGVYFTDPKCRDAYTRASASCQRMGWQLVKDKVRRANEFRSSKGIAPINLSDGHYSEYAVWGSRETTGPPVVDPPLAPRPPPTRAEMGRRQQYPHSPYGGPAVPIRPSPASTVPIRPATTMSLAPKRAAEAALPSVKRQAGAPAPNSSGGPPLAKPLPLPSMFRPERSSSLIDRQRAERERQQQLKPWPGPGASPTSR